LRICIAYGTRKETTQQETASSSLIGKQEKEKNKDKEEDNQKKDEDNLKDKGFQQSKETVVVIFSGVSGSRSNH
jgi:hypothetical protein